MGMTMPNRLPLLLPLALAACGPSGPNAEQLSAIESAADNQVAQIEAKQEAETDRLTQEAQALTDQAANAASYDAARLKTRADALRQEARLVEEHGEAQVRAIRDQARADKSRIQAQ